jgi:hypothetical protein
MVFFFCEVLMFSVFLFLFSSRGALLMCDRSIRIRSRVGAAGGAAGVGSVPYFVNFRIRIFRDVVVRFQ